MITGGGKLAETCSGWPRFRPSERNGSELLLKADLVPARPIGTPIHLGSGRRRFEATGERMTAIGREFVCGMVL